MSPKIIVICFALFGAALAKKSLRPDGRIIGGQKVTIEDNPWQVSIQVLGSHSCGGSILDENTVVTAAHCAGIMLELFGEVVAGASNLLDGDVFRTTISSQIVHENYGAASGYDNDIALLKLSQPIPLGNTMQPVKLPESTSDEPAAGDAVLVTGWGVLNQGDIFTPAELYGVEVNVVARDECNSAYAETQIPVDQSMICAGVQQGGKDACQGDSGGPLTKDGVLVGIVSWGYGCAVAGYPGVYTNVANLRQWIKTNSGV